MIRTYLGRRRCLEKHSKYKSFSLRNYPLHIDQVEELKLDGKLYAGIMAETLAHLYWRAIVDANDVEFVLTPPRKAHTNQLGARSAHSSIIKSERLGGHVVWILDFDCCRQITLDEKGVEEAVAAFYGNGSYYPRPGRDNNMDQALWEEFKHRFLKRAKPSWDKEARGSFACTVGKFGRVTKSMKHPSREFYTETSSDVASQSCSPGTDFKCRRPSQYAQKLRFENIARRTGEARHHYKIGAPTR